MAQRESQLVAEGLAGPVPLVEDVPSLFLPAARLDVLSGYGAWAADGGLNAECLDQGRPASEPCIRRHRLLLEGSGVINSMGLISSSQGRKLLFIDDDRRGFQILWLPQKQIAPPSRGVLQSRQTLLPEALATQARGVAVHPQLPHHSQTLSRHVFMLCCKLLYY
jgi:hypothetical protein